MRDSDSSTAIQNVCRVVVPTDDGLFWMVRENKPKGQARWNFAGGEQKSGETLEGAGTRELEEELGWQIRILRRILTVERPDEGRTIHIFLGEIVGGELHLQAEEIREARPFARREILAMQAEDLRDPACVIEVLDRIGSP